MVQKQYRDSSPERLAFCHHLAPFQIFRCSAFNRFNREGQPLFAVICDKHNVPRLRSAIVFNTFTGDKHLQFSGFALCQQRATVRIMAAICPALSLPLSCSGPEWAAAIRGIHFERTAPCSAVEAYRFSR